MGYDLHITRKDDWVDETGPTITQAEWLCVIEEDPELSLDQETPCMMANGEYVYAAWNGEAGALGWYDGEISVKNPDEPLIRKMVQIAQILDAKVQGDDGEIYREDGSSFQPELTTPEPQPTPGIIDRIVAWFRHRRGIRELQAATPAFRVGQRVKNPWNVFGTVIKVDRKANRGLGSVWIRQDDGHELHLMYVASCLEIVDDKGQA